MNTLIRMAFRGTAYHGFQVQKNAPTVCAALQDAMQGVFGVRPDVKGCSRTDAGVHARDFCVSFRQQTDIPCDKLPLALNSRLPDDIRVLTARRVPAAFHARYAAIEKEYEYVVLNSAVEDVFAQGLYHRVPGPIDATAMDAAGRVLCGHHDFAAFMSSGSDVQDTRRTITRLSVRREGERVILAVAADGFLYNMVRIIAGTLLAVGQGRMGREDVAGALAWKDRAKAGSTLPAKGLFLHRVTYPEAQLLVNSE